MLVPYGDRFFGIWPHPDDPPAMAAVDDQATNDKDIRYHSMSSSGCGDGQKESKS